MKLLPLRLLAVLCLLWPAHAQGRVFLLLNGETSPGELGFPMNGSNTALTSGGEAVWFNPAGLASAGSSRLMVAGTPLRYLESGVGGENSVSVKSGSGNIASVHPLGNTRQYPRFYYGLSLRMSPDRFMTGSTRDARSGTEASLPAGLVGALDIDGSFPEGFSIRETAEGTGELRGYSPAVALGAAITSWFRIGISLRFDHLILREQSQSTLVYSGSYTNGGSTNTLDGYALSGLIVAGESNRIAMSMGFQADLSPGIVLGVSLDFPSDTLAGNGSVYLNQSRSITIVDGGVTSGNSEVIFIQEEGLGFRLDSPGRVTLGLAFISDSVLFEMDLTRIRPQSPYEVFPEVESRPPSTGAARLGPLETSGEGALRISVGMAFKQTTSTSYLVGIASEPSTVPSGDPLFRRMDLTSVTVGMYHTRGRFSGSIGLALIAGEERSVRYVSPEGGETITQSGSYQEILVQVGGSIEL